MAPLTYVMNHPVYFSVSRRTISRGVWIGVFVAFIPIPMQMGVAALLALIARVNIPVAVLGVWVTNPLTMWPLFYLAYRLGAAILHIPIEPWPADFNFLETIYGMGKIWEVTLYGGVVLGLSLATLSYIAISMIWSLSAAIRYRERKLKRGLRLRKAAKADPAEPGTNLD